MPLLLLTSIMFLRHLTRYMLDRGNPKKLHSSGDGHHKGQMSS